MFGYHPMRMFGFGSSIFTILLFACVAFSMYANYRVKNSFEKYSHKRTKTAMTGLQVARRLLDINGLNHIRVEMASGILTDHYDHRKDVIRLSHSVYNGNSISAVSVAAHEVGHAIQKKDRYSYFIFRDALATPVSFASNISWILIVAGLALTRSAKYGFGGILLDVGIIAFAIITLFHLVTLPVEINASMRAVRALRDNGIIFTDEIDGAKSVLTGAALTYVYRYKVFWLV